MADAWPIIFMGEPTNIIVLFYYHCLFWLPPRPRSLQNRQNIHVFIQMHNIVHDKQNKFMTI
jgi:hypothetical protein